MSFQSRDRFLGSPHLYVSEATSRLTLRQRMVFVWTLWRQRTEMRRRLAEMDARSLRDVGISPAAAAYESGKPFWRKVGDLR